MYQILVFFSFLLKSTNQHGVHSPFVYDLVTKCFYNKNRFEFYSKIKAYRNQIYQDKSIINVTDFGAGSRVFKSNKRQVNKIAKNVGLTTKNAFLLGRLVNYLNINSVLEIGTSLGFATSVIKLAKPITTITTVEGCKETLDKAKDYFNKNGLEKIETHHAQFDDFFNKLNSNTVFDLIYIDGNHTKEATLNYFEKSLKHIHQDSVIILDDIYWSKEMNEAWELIKQNKNVSISIDTFNWGFLFFRSENKHQEHFVIRT